MVENWEGLGLELVSQATPTKGVACETRLELVRVIDRKQYI